MLRGFALCVAFASVSYAQDVWSGHVTIRDFIIRPEAPAKAKVRYENIITAIAQDISTVEEKLAANPDRIQRQQLQRDRAALVEALRVAKERRGGRAELTNRTFAVYRASTEHASYPTGLVLVSGVNGLALVNREAGVVYHRDPWQGALPTRRFLSVPLRSVDDLAVGQPWRDRESLVGEARVGDQRFYARVVPSLPNVYRLLINKNHEGDVAMEFLAALPGLPVRVEVTLEGDTKLVSEVVEFDENEPAKATIVLPDVVYEAD